MPEHSERRHPIAPTAPEAYAWPQPIQGQDGSWSHLPPPEPGRTAPPNAFLGRSAEPKPPKRSWSTRRKVLTAGIALVGLFVVGGVAGALSGGGDGGGGATTDPAAAASMPPISSEQAAANSAASKAPPAPPAPEATTPKPKPVAPALTTAQENAVGTAKDYLETQGFSRSGLVDQLKFEGYSTADARFAVNYIKADWKAQAARVAKGYLETQHFSRSGLIGQLEFEGFTRTEATYGVDQAGL